MPQMDSSTFFPQVFWLILFISFSFFFFLKTFFSYSIRILKLKNKFILNLLYYFNVFFKSIFNIFLFLINTLFFKFIKIFSKNNLLYNWNFENFKTLKKEFNFIFLNKFVKKDILKINS